MQKKYLTISLVILLLFLPAGKGQSQEKHYYFYHPEITIGSEVMFNPLSVILNGGYDVLRNGNHSKDITAQYYKIGAQNVLKRVFNPLDNIEKYGWRKFLTSEVFPVSTNSDDFQYFPNYGNHLVGHGMKYVKLSEWYDYHGCPYPKTFAMLTSLSYAFLNEVIENRDNTYITVDPIADMLIFNPLGYFLFSFESVKKFFSETLPMYDWSLQPLINPFNNRLENAGEQYVVNYGINERYNIFFYWGTSGILGLTYKLKSAYNISLGAGGIVNKLIAKQRIRSKFWTLYVAPETIDGAVGLFYDYKHSLLSSLILTGPFYYNLQLNIYPGLLEVGPFKPGVYLAAGEIDGFQIGISMAYFPFGLNYKF